MIKGTKTPGVFRFISLGDIHFIHHQTPTGTIIRNLDRHCTNERIMRDLDMVVVTGDVWDRLVHSADDNLHLVNRWITLFLFRCARLNVKVRIVEGTPSHDRMQSRFFVELKENANIPVDLHYATTLSIEYIDDYDLNFLYVPDKWRADTSETLQEVRLLMKRHDLEQVDFAIMHGAFEYQLPAVVKEPSHDSDVYLDLVRYFILIGHVHFPTQKERILAAGSYDRLYHGEEGPKGFYDVAVRAPDDYNITFVENTSAKQYVTVDCRGMDTKQANVAIRRATKDLPGGSAIRLHCERHSPVVGDMDAIKQAYPDYEWSTPKIENETTTKKETMDTLMKMDMEAFIPIDATTISGLVEAELAKHTNDEATLTRCQQQLAELIE